MNADAARLLSLAVSADQRASEQRRLTIALVLAAHDGGASWADIGRAFGITRQAAHERFHGVNRPGRPLRRRERGADRLSASADRAERDAESHAEPVSESGADQHDQEQAS